MGGQKKKKKKIKTEAHSFSQFLHSNGHTHSLSLSLSLHLDPINPDSGARLYELFRICSLCLKMGVTQAFELIKDCGAIKLVDPRKEGPCEIDGSAVSYFKFKTTEGRLLLKQLKKMAKEHVSTGAPVPIQRLAHWDQESWSLPPLVTNKNLALDLSALHLSMNPGSTFSCNTSSTNSTTTQQESSTGRFYSASDTLPSPSHTPTDVFHELNSARDVVWPLLANVLNKLYDRLYKKSEDFIHYDGPPTSQKAFAHDRRQLATRKQHLKLFEYFRIAEARLSQMEAKPKSSSRQISRFKSFLSKFLFPCWIRTRGVDPRATMAIASELKDSHGWKAHQCAGQFDVCVGKKARENPNLAVVSTDSDLLFLGADRLLRLQPKGMRFYCYPIKDIISHCGLETLEEWVAAAVVSQNDYDPSVGRTSFSTAIKDIANVRNDWIRKRSKNRSIDRYVKELCRRKNIHHNTVKKSMESFVELVETPLDRYTQGLDEIDESIRRIVYRVEALTLRTRLSKTSPMTLTPLNSIPAPLLATKDHENVVDVLAIRQLQSGSATLPYVALPVSDIAFPAATATRNSERIEVMSRANGFQRYTCGHKYGPRAFTSAFTSPQKNIQPVSVKDRTIGRPGSMTSVLIDEVDNDDDLDTFPVNAITPSNVTAVSFPAILTVSTDENTPPNEDTMIGHESEINSDDNSDDISEDNSGDNSDNDDDSGKGSDYKEGQQTSPQPIGATHSRKRAIKKIAYPRSSRKARDAEIPLNENAVPRKINPTNMMADVVAFLHPMRAMRPGRIESCLVHSLKESFPHMSDQDHNLLSGHLLETVQTMARVHTDLLREGLMVTNLYIAKTFKSFPAIHGDQGREHGDKRMECFNSILLKGKRESFFQRLVHRLIRWDSDDTDLKKASSPELLASDNIFQEYLQTTSQRLEPPFRAKDRDVCEGSFLSQCARTLSDMVGGHVYKFPLELKKRVLLHNPSWASSEIGSGILDSIDSITGKLRNHDCVSMHFILNMFLPAKAQIQILPQVGYEDGFCSFTERQFVSCLLKDFRMDRRNKIRPIAKKMRRLSSAEQDKQHSLARILDDIFGPKASAEKNTQDEVGRLSFFLFLNGSNTSYRRGANMLWTKDSQNLAPSSFPTPTSALQQKSLKSRAIFKSDNVSAIKEARTTLEKMDAKDPRYASIKVEFKDLIRQSLQRPNIYQEQIDKSESGQTRQKYVLSGDLSTNGHDLRVMAYKLTESKRSTPPTIIKAARVAESGNAVSESVKLSPAAEAQSKPRCPDNDYSSEAHSPADVEEQCIPSGESLTTVLSPPVPASSIVFPWSTAPMVQGWPYASKKFDSQEKVNSLFRNINGQSGIRTLGIDPGIASTATATLIHSRYEKDNINLNIPRGPRDNIDRRYRKQQSHLKIDAGITEIEDRLMQRKPIELKLVVGDSDIAIDGGSEITSNSQDTIASYTKAVEEATRDYESAFKAHLVNVANKASILRSFYGSTRFKQDKYDYREALRHDLDMATTAILRMRKHVPNRQPSDEDLKKVLFQLDEDLDTSMAVVNGLPNVKDYDWEPYLRLMDEVKRQSETGREALLVSKSFTRRRKKIAKSLYKRGFLNLNPLPDNERKSFLQSPLVIGLGDGDFRSWRGHSQGGCKFTKNLIRQTKNLVKDLARSKEAPVVIELVKIPEFRTSIFCCSCHFRMRVRGRSVICDECNWERDRDHNAATNMSNGLLQFLRDGQWPAPLDYEKAKLLDSTITNDALNS